MTKKSEDNCLNIVITGASEDSLNALREFVAQSPDFSNNNIFPIHEEINPEQLKSGKSFQKLDDNQYGFTSLDFRKALDKSHWVMITDGDGNILDVNDKVCTISGYSKKELIGQHSRVHQSDSHSSLFFQEMWNTISKGQVWRGEIKNKSKNGSLYWIDFSIVPIFDKRGNLYQYLSIGYETTEQKNKNFKLKLMSEVITHANDAVFIAEGSDIISHSDSRIVYVNQAFEKMTGYSADEIVGKKPEILQGFQSNKKELQRIKDLIQAKESCRFTILKYTKTDIPYWVNVSLSPVSDNSGKVSHWIAIEREVTTAIHKEVQKKILTEISSIFNMEKSLKFCLKRILKHLVENIDLTIGEIWLPNRKQTELILASSFSNGELGDHFYKKTKSINTFKTGEGLPGTVWNCKELKLWDNIGKNKKFIRRKAAAAIGMNGAFAMPLIHSNEVVGILLVASEKAEMKLNQFIGLFKKLETFLGSEIKRKQQEEEMNALYNFAPDVLAISSPEGYFVKVNPAFCDLLGYSEKEICFQPFENFVHPEDLNDTRKKFEETKTGKRQSNNFQNRYLTKFGNYKWISWNSSESFGEEKLVFAFGRDVTEIRELQELHHNATQLARIGSWEFDLARHSVYFSRVSLEIFELEKNREMDLTRFLQFFRDDKREAAENQIRGGMDHGIPWDFEIPIITENGNERWIRIIGKAKFKDGKCTRIYGSLQDVHQRKMIELRLQNTADNIPGVLFQYKLFPDGTDQMLQLTKQAADLWKYSAEECMENVELIWNQTKGGGDYEKVQRSVLRSAELLEPWHCKYRSRQPDGKLIWLEGFGTPHRLPDGSTIWDSVLIDITEQKRLEDLMDRSSKLARIGSWELDLRDPENSQMFWSEMTRDILEVDDKYNASLTGGFEFYTPESRKRIEKAVQLAIEKGQDFDLELLILTSKGKEKWIRCIGQTDWISNRCVRMFGSFQDIHQLKSAEIAFKNATEERRKILDSISDGFYAVDREWNISFFNAEAENMLGVKSGDVLGENLWTIFNPAVDTELFAHYHRVMLEKESETFEYFYPPLNSWFDISAYPAENGISVYFKNINERKESQAQILKKTQKLDAIAKFNGLLIDDNDWLLALRECLKDFGEITEVDRVYFFECDEVEKGKVQSVTMILEWVRDGVKPQIDNPFHEKLKLSEISSFAEALSGNQMVYNRIVNEIEDKGFKKILQDQDIKSLLALPIFTGSDFRGFIGFDDCSCERIWEQEEITFMETICNNLISAIKNVDSRSALQKVFEERTTILESIGDGFFAVDDDFTVTYWNQRAEELLHTPRESIIGKNLWKIFEDAKNTRSFTAYREVIENKSPIQFQDYYDALDKWFEVSAYPAGNGLSVFFMDISERKRASENLRKLNQSLQKQARELAISNAELEQFAYVASHDLQEPLRMVTSFLSQLEKKYKVELDEKAQTYIHFAVDGAKRMRQIILNLLEYSRVGQLDAQKEEIDLNELVDDYCILRSQLIEDQSAVIHGNDLPVIKSYLAPITQVFHNLLDNALKYSKEGVPPEIKVGAKSHRNHWEIAISDNGQGIEEEYFKKIFVIFQRLHHNEKYSGTGMGLAIVKKIVDNLEGKIWLESKLNKGSTFYFTVPKIQKNNS